MTISAPGIYLNIGSREYFDEPCPQAALSNSGVKILLAKTPAEFAHAHPALNPDCEDGKSSAAKRFGDVAHQLALGKGRGYAVGPFKTWASNDAKAFKEDAEKQGLTPVKAPEFKEAEGCAAVMRAKIQDTLNAIAGTIRVPVPVPYETEVVAVWQEDTAHGPIWCRIMMDVWCPALNVILDPKFSNRMADGVFESHAVAMGWDLQGAWYPRGIEAIFPELAGRIRFINLVVSPDAPHVHRVREADEATRYSCQLEIERAKEIFGRCLYRNEWPGYPRMIESWTARSYTLNERAMRSAMDEGLDP